METPVLVTTKGHFLLRFQEVKCNLSELHNYRGTGDLPWNTVSVILQEESLLHVSFIQAELNLRVVRLYSAEEKGNISSAIK